MADNAAQPENNVEPPPRRYEPPPETTNSFQTELNKSRDTTPTSLSRENGEKNSYAAKETEPGKEMSTFDGRTFSRMGDSNQWSVTGPNGEIAATVEDVKLNSDKSLSYKLAGGAQVKELPDGTKQVEFQGRKFTYDKDGQPMGDTSGGGKASGPTPDANPEGGQQDPPPAGMEGGHPAIPSLRRPTDQPAATGADDETDTAGGKPPGDETDPTRGLSSGDEKDTRMFTSLTTPGLNLDTPNPTPPSETKTDASTPLDDKALASIDSNKMDAKTAEAIATRLSRPNPEPTDNLTRMLEKGLSGPAAKQVMQGIVEAMRKDGEGTKSLSDLLLKSGKTDAFKDVSGRLAEMAAQGNPAAIKTLAGLTTGIADRREGGTTLDYSSWAKQHLTETAAKKPELASTITNSLIDANKLRDSDPKGTGSPNYMETLTKAAAAIPADLTNPNDRKAVDGALELARKEFDDANKTIGHPNSKASAENLLRMAPHLTAKDANLVGKHLTNPEVLGALERNGGSLSQPFQKELASNLTSVIASGRAHHGGVATKGDLYAAMQALPMVAGQLSARDLQSIASGVGVASDRPVSRELNLSDTDRKNLKTMAGDVALSALKSSDSNETRKAAIDMMNAGIKPEKQLSSKDQDAISKLYADGKIKDPEMIGKLGKLTRSMGMPASAEQMLAEVGTDSSRIKEYAAAIRRNYGKPGESGDEALRRVLHHSRIVEALSPPDRATLMGWDKPGANKPGTIQEQTPRELNLVGMMVNGVLQDSPQAALIDRNLPNGLDRMTSEASQKAHDDRTALTNLQEERMNKLNELARITKSGPETSTAGDILRLAAFVGTGGLVPGVEEAASRLRERIRSDGVDSKLARQQTELLKGIEQLSRDIDKGKENAGVSGQRSTHLNIVRDVETYKRFLSDGKTSGADCLAMNLYNKYGIGAGALNATGSDQGILGRAKDKGESSWGRLPDYSKGVNPNDGASEDMRRFQSALGLREVDVSQPGITHSKDKPTPEARGLAQINQRTISDAGVRELFVRNAMKTLDNDPLVKKMTGKASEIAAPLQQLSKLFEAGMTGTPYDAFVKGAKDSAGKIDEVMKSVTSEDIKGLRDRIDAMEKAKAKMDENGGNDPNNQAYRQLNNRLNGLKSIHDMFNGHDEARYGGMLKNKDGSPMRSPTGGIMYKDSYKDVRNMVNAAFDGTLRSSTYSNWMKENGPVIAATVGAMAATAATVATFGGATPLMGAALTSVGALVGSQGAREALFQLNQKYHTDLGPRGDKGSDIGNWYRMSSRRSEGDNWKELGKVLGHTAAELALDTLANVGTGFAASSVLRGGSREAIMKSLASQIEKSPNLGHLARKSERLMNPGIASGAKSLAKEFGSNFMTELGHTSIFAGAHILGSGALKDDFGKSLMSGKSGWTADQMVDMGLTTSLAIGAGLLRGARMNGVKHEMTYDLKPGASRADFMKHMQKEGFIVKPSESNPKVWEVTPVGAGKAVQPMTLVDKRDTKEGHSTPPGRPGGRSINHEFDTRHGALPLTGEKDLKPKGGKEGAETPKSDYERLNDLLKKHGIQGPAIIRDEVMKPLAKGLEKALGPPLDEKLKGVKPEDRAAIEAEHNKGMPDRLKAAQDALNEIATKHLGLPPITLELTDGKYSAGGYKGGKIYVDQNLVNDKDKLTNILAHELTHHEQVTLLTRRINELLPPGDRGKPDKIMEYYNNNVMMPRSSTEPSVLNREHVEASIKDGKPLSPEQVKRADHLLSVLSPSDAPNFAGGASHWAKQHAELAKTLSGLGNDRLRANLANPDLRHEINSTMRHHPDADAKKEVRDMMGKQSWTDNELDTLKKHLGETVKPWMDRHEGYHKGYSNHIMEVEARVAGLAAEAVGRSIAEANARKLEPPKRTVDPEKLLRALWDDLD
ncbi:MAG: hypothetical protein K2X93_28960 [Candidatus Obscuribacterales bacterium]|nr:hypothetical protein [Candidatus Obscuribacterales bacterium]